MPPEKPRALRELLRAVASGRLAPEEAQVWLQRHQIEELGDATIDLQRQLRRGKPEVIYCPSKTPGQVVAIARRIAEAGQNVLATRVTPEQHAALVHEFGADGFHWHELPCVAHLEMNPMPRRQGVVGVLAAGTSDLPVAEEAAVIAEAFGSRVERAYDVGVAGLHRLFRHAELLLRARVLVVVAGMEGALPSVVSGLTSAPVIAVPTSVGYGAHFQGLAPLLTMINSCSPGIGVVNIDNGFGAGYLADTINAIGERDAEDQ